MFESTSLMIILGLTGSIGMGKSTTAFMFKEVGVPVYDADATVHKMYGVGGAAVEPIRAVFPTAISEDGYVDRDVLKKIVLSRPKDLKKLEDIVHPLAGQARLEFLEKHASNGTPIVLMDIPLLFETGGEKSVDKIIVVTAPFKVQKERVLAREGMTEENFVAILAKQVPDAEKRERADYVIDTSQGMDVAREQVHFILEDLKSVK
jgi:dephospho-CoA kinase